MENQKKVLIAVTCVVVVLIAGFAVWALNRKAPAVQHPVSVQGVKVDAQAGQIISGFPLELVLDSGASVDSSYKIPYDTFTQYSVFLSSDKSIKDIYTSYLNYVNNNGFTVVNKSESTKLDAIYATKGSEALLVNISEQNGRREVIISYKK